jgi:preprotein translocase subunit Sec63
VLGLIGIPNEEDLKKARNKLLKKWHPDKVERQASEIREEANKKTKKINDVYEYLNGQDLSQLSKSEWPSSKTNTYSWKSVTEVIKRVSLKRCILWELLRFESFWLTFRTRCWTQCRKVLA